MPPARASSPAAALAGAAAHAIRKQAGCATAPPVQLAQRDQVLVGALRHAKRIYQARVNRHPKPAQHIRRGGRIVDALHKLPRVLKLEHHPAIALRQTRAPLELEFLAGRKEAQSGEGGQARACAAHSFAAGCADTDPMRRAGRTCGRQQQQTRHHARPQHVEVTAGSHCC
eukprot:scaffold30415_cov124-Isochrysis_galbana.AAC.11